MKKYNFQLILYVGKGGEPPQPVHQEHFVASSLKLAQERSERSMLKYAKMEQGIIVAWSTQQWTRWLPREFCNFTFTVYSWKRGDASYCMEAKLLWRERTDKHSYGLYLKVPKIEPVWNLHV